MAGCCPRLTGATITEFTTSLTISAGSPHLYLLCASAVGEGGKHSIGEISNDQRTNRLVTETLCLSKKSEVNLKLSRRCMSGRPGQGGDQGV